MVDSSYRAVWRVDALEERASAVPALRRGTRLVLMLLLALAVCIHPLRAAFYDLSTGHAPTLIAAEPAMSSDHRHAHAAEAGPSDPAETDMWDHNALDHVHENANMPPWISVSPAAQGGTWVARHLHDEPLPPASRVDRPPRA